MPGPFLEYTEPNVYTRTLTDQTVVTLTGGLRIPVFIGVGSETLSLTDQEIIRGSSATTDNAMVGEDVSSQLNGINREFTVQKFPIVNGDGTGTVTNNPNDVNVYINGAPVGVAQLFGDTGKIVLSVIPRDTDEVTIDYFFKRTDTLITDEDLSEQANGFVTEFKVFYPPIVDGSNGGVATTNPNRVSVRVDGVLTPVSTVDGQSGTFTLLSAPAASSTVLVTYYTNTWQDTFDYLPVSNITEVIRVGTAPGRSDFIEGLDFVIEENKILWGNSFSITSGTTAPLSTPFGSTHLNAFLYDNKVYARPCAGNVNSLNKEFDLEYIPTEGTGEGRATDDVSKVQVFVGPNIKDAIDAGEVVVTKLDGSLRKITLQLPPSTGNYVYATYWHNMIADDSFTFTSVSPSTVSTNGTFTVVSSNNGDVTQILEDRPSASVSDPDFATEGVTYPAGGFDAQTIPGFSPEETILLNFINDKEYLVISSIGVDGTNGSGSLDQTYIDPKTGVRFSVMRGTTVTYTAGDILEFDVSKTFVTDSVPYYSIPGLKVTTNSTLNVASGNQALMNTYNKSGLEPNVGDFYYVTLNYAKEAYPIEIYTKIKDVESNIGSINTDNRLSLAAYLAFQNGAVALALAQVLRDNSGVDANFQSYIDKLKELESPITESGVRPNIVCCITADTEVTNSVRLHCEKLSTIRYRSERTGVYGHAVGTEPESAQAFARRMKSERLVGMYPDGAIIGLVDELGNVNEAVVDGSFLAAAFSGLAVNPNFDVATPLTNKLLIGFRRLVRQLDSIAMNQTAISGMTVLEDVSPNLLIRQAMTTNPATVLTREPSIVFIKDYVQQQTRSVLNRFIGIKLTPVVLQDIEITLSNLLANLQNLEIISQYQNVSAEQDPNDPTIVQVEAFYSPIFPLNWIVTTFNLRVRL